MSKFYVVWKGFETGIYSSWSECEKNVKGYKGAIFKSFSSLTEAGEALAKHPKDYVGNINDGDYSEVLGEVNREKAENLNPKKVNTITKYKKPNNAYRKMDRKQVIGLVGTDKAICVDSSCKGYYGEMEFRGVFLDTAEIVFSSQKYPLSTNNIGEFLAIVKAIEILEKTNKRDYIIFSDSEIAIGWVKKGKVNTNLFKFPETEELWKHIDAAERYLEKYQGSFVLKKWLTKQWGEIPADYNRKARHKPRNKRGAKKGTKKGKDAKK